jgi:uncharacterized protein
MKRPPRRSLARQPRVAKVPVTATPPARKSLALGYDALMMEAPPDPYRYPLKLPTLPPQVLNGRKRPQLAMDFGGNGGFPFGGFLNANSVAGLSAFGLYFPGYPWLAELAQRTEYRQPTETIAKEMTRKWIALKSKGKGNKETKIKELEGALEEFKIQTLFRKVTEYDGFYGLGFIFIDIEGNEDHALPLPITPQTILKGSLRGFMTIEPMWTTPLVWNSTDPTHPNFYKAESWMVLGRETHQTRLLRFVSREVPDIIRPAYNFGGISLTQLIQPYVDRWLSTVGAVNKLINNYSIVNLATDMAALLSGGPSTELLKRMRFFTQTRDNQGVFLSDKEAEQLMLHAVQLSGLSELQAQAQEHMAAPTHLPLVVMTGITPAGLNASSDSEIEIFHDWNHSMQESLYTDPLTKILHILQLHMYGTIDREITFEYVALKELVGEAASRVKKTQSEMDQVYMDSGVIAPEEVRQRLQNDPDSGYDNLSGSLPPQQPGEGNGESSEFPELGGSTQEDEPADERDAKRHVDWTPQPSDVKAAGNEEDQRVEDDRRDRKDLESAAA